MNITKEDLEKQLSSIENLKFVGLEFRSDVVEKKYHNCLFYIVGNDYENEIGVEKSNFEVFSLSDEDFVFINSSLVQLINCINVLTQTIDLEKNYVEKTRCQQVKEVKREFRKMDKKSLSKGCWWSYILEEVKDGLL